MKKLFCNIKRNFSLLLLMAVASFSYADGLSDKPSISQRNNALARQYQHVDVLWKGDKSSTKGHGGHAHQSFSANALVVSSAKTSDVIDLPGTPENNSELKKFINEAKINMRSMRSANNPDIYIKHQEDALSALDSIVNCYLISRMASKIPLSPEESNADSFLQIMASLKIDLMRTSLGAEDLNSMLDQLSEARSILVDLSGVVQ
jgi:hypothetical protein